MSDVYTVIGEKDKTIKLLASALNQACQALDTISYSDTLDEAVLFAEATTEEIMEELVAGGLDKELIPNI